MSKHVLTGKEGYGVRAKSVKKGKDKMSSIDSDTESMLSEKVSSTAAESRKNSKPIMEKRRRARINASLAELKSLLLEVMKKEGARQNKMEKADILEITVRHLRTLQKQQFSALATNDPTLINKYRLGFNECASEVSSFLGSMEGSDAEVRSKLLNHLANCMVNPDPPSQSSRVPSSQCMDNLRSSPPQTTGFCKTEDIQTHPHQPSRPENNVVQNVIQNGLRTNVMDNGVLTVQAQDSLVANTISAALPTTTTATLSVQGLLNNQQLQIPQFQQQQQQQQQPMQQFQQHIMQQPQQVQIQAIQPQTTVQQQPSMQVQKLVSGVQLIPTKMSTGEMAFIIPANLLSSGNVNNYVIPMVQSQTTQVSAAVAPITMACSQTVNTAQTQNINIKPVPAPISIPTRPKEPMPVYGQQNTNGTDQPVIYVQGDPLRNRTDDRTGPNFNLSVSPSKQEDMWRPW